MDKFTLINMDRSRIKVFEPFEDLSKPSPSIDAMMISYGCVYKRSSKRFINYHLFNSFKTSSSFFVKVSVLNNSPLLFNLDNLFLRTLISFGFFE